MKAHAVQATPNLTRLDISNCLAEGQASCLSNLQEGLKGVSPPKRRHSPVIFWLNTGSWSHLYVDVPLCSPPRDAVLHLSRNNLSGWPPTFTSGALHGIETAQLPCSLTAIDLSGCIGLTPYLLQGIMARCTALKDLDVSGCRDLAPKNVPLRNEPRDVVCNKGSDAPPTAGNITDLLVGLGETTVQLAALALEDVTAAADRQASGWKPSRFRRLAVGWGFDGASIRAMLARSADSLTCLEVIMLSFR